MGGGRQAPGTYQDIPMGVPDLSVLTISVRHILL